MKFYAVCNVNGPISVELDGETVDETLASFAEIDGREAIDAARTDIEDELGFDGSDLSDSEMHRTLEEEGAYPVRSLESVAGRDRVYHVADGWYLWATCDESDIKALGDEAAEHDDPSMVEACENAGINLDARKKCLAVMVDNAGA